MESTQQGLILLCSTQIKNRIWEIRMLTKWRSGSEAYLHRANCGRNGRKACNFRSHNRCLECDASQTSEIPFLQWFEIMDCQTLYMDEIDITLKCIRLGWQRTSGKVGYLSSTPKYGLALAGSIRGSVHLVNRNFPIDIVDRTHPRRIHAKPLFEKKTRMAVGIVRHESLL